MSVLQGDAVAERPGRGVLEGAFVLLDTLVRFQDGAGLTVLAREAGLPKTTTYRLIEQLVELGAVQRHGQRYFVGRLLARLGSAWQPSPTLRRAAREPVHMLASLSSAAVTVWTLHDSSPRAVLGARGAFGDQLRDAPPAGELLPYTAAAKVLFAMQLIAKPQPGLSERDLHRIRADCEHGSGVVIDKQGVMAGVCCVAAPVRLHGGRTVASISASVLAPTVPPGLADLVRRAAGEIARNMTVR